MRNSTGCPEDLALVGVLGGNLQRTAARPSAIAAWLMRARSNVS